MSTFPNYPTDFAALSRPFTPEEIEKLLQQSEENVKFTIDILKNREVNATKALEELKNKINDLLEINNDDELISKFISTNEIVKLIY